MQKINIFENIRVHFFVKAACASIYALLVVSIPSLFGLSNMAIKDRENYLNYFDSSEVIISDILSYEIHDVIFMEPLFAAFCLFLSILFNDPIISLNIFIFISTFLAAYVVLSLPKVPIWGKVLVLFFPWFLVNYIMTLRQGFASSIFYLSYFYFKGYWRGLFFFISGLIHYLIFILIFLYVFSRSFLLINFSFEARTFLIFLSIFAISFVFYLFFRGFLPIPFENIDELFSYYTQNVQIRFGFGLLFWGLIFCLYISEGKSFVEKNIFVILLVGIYVTFVLFFPFVSRLVQALSPLILAAGFSLHGIRKIVFVSIVVLHVIFFWAASFYSGGPAGMLV